MRHLNQPAALYDRDFFARRSADFLRSAREIVPIVLSLTHPHSVVDVGCGTGTWLSVFQENGIDDVLGMDGPYVDGQQLTISSDKFLSMDLTAPASIGRGFELAICLEVAEHLPSNAADRLVEFLCSLSSMALFSAAIPHQGGRGHVNERWPEYWVNKFSKHNYLVLDAVRPKIWTNPFVQWWYAQNILLLVRQDLILTSPQLQDAYARTEPKRIALVHPKRYLIEVQANRRLRRSTTSDGKTQRAAHVEHPKAG